MDISPESRDESSELILILLDQLIVVCPLLFCIPPHLQFLVIAGNNMQYEGTNSITVHIYSNLVRPFDNPATGEFLGTIGATDPKVK